MATDPWTILASVSQAVAAVGTFATVAIASRQWSRQWRPRLRININTMLTVPAGGPREDFVQVEVLNTGIRKVLVKAIEYRPHRFARARWFVQPDFEIPWTSRLPARIELGEEARFLWRPADWSKGLSGALADEIQRHPFYRRVWRRMLVCEVVVSTGERFRTRLPKVLLQRAERSVAERLAESGAAT